MLISEICYSQGSTIDQMKEKYSYDQFVTFKDTEGINLFVTVKGGYLTKIINQGNRMYTVSFVNLRDGLNYTTEYNWSDRAMPNFKEYEVHLRSLIQEEAKKIQQKEFNKNHPFRDLTIEEYKSIALSYEDIASKYIMGKLPPYFYSSTALVGSNSSKVNFYVEVHSNDYYAENAFIGKVIIDVKKFFNIGEGLKDKATFEKKIKSEIDKLISKNKDRVQHLLDTRYKDFINTGREEYLNNDHNKVYEKIKDLDNKQLHRLKNGIKSIKSFHFIENILILMNVKDRTLDKFKVSYGNHVIYIDMFNSATPAGMTSYGESMDPRQQPRWVYRDHIVREVSLDVLKTTKSEINMDKGFDAFKSQITRSVNLDFKRVFPNQIKKRLISDFYQVYDKETGKVLFEVIVTKNKRRKIKSVIYLDFDSGDIIKESNY
jgi:hypothetical protein